MDEDLEDLEDLLHRILQTAADSYEAIRVTFEDEAAAKRALIWLRAKVPESDCWLEYSRRGPAYEFWARKKR